MRPTDQAAWRPIMDSWVNQGSVYGWAANPAAGLVLADTGQLARGWYDFTIVGVGAPAYYIFYIDHRNAANTLNLYRVYSGFGNGVPSVLPLHNWSVGLNERIRVVVAASLAGSYGASIHWTMRCEPN